METAQIMMMPMASASSTTAQSAVAGLSASPEAGTGFGSLLGQTLEMLQESGISLQVATAETNEVPALVQPEVAGPVPGATDMLAALLAETQDVPGVDADQQGAVGLEQSSQLAGFLQAAMMIPAAVTVPVVKQVPEEQSSADAGMEEAGGAELEMALLEEQDDTGSELLLMDELALRRQQAGQERADLTIVTPVAGRPDFSQQAPARPAHNQPAVAPDQQSVTTITVDTPVRAEVATVAQAATAVAVAESRTAMPENAPVSKNAATTAVPVRFAQSSDVIAAMAQPEQQRQQEQSLPGENGKGSEQNLRVGTTGTVAGEPAGFDLKMKAVVSSDVPSGQALAVAQQQRQGGIQELQATELVKTAPEPQLMRQVTDRLAGLEMKQGVEQISIKLSPQHLGNLQLNLRMEDHQVRVEIVAEHRAVREALLQQVDQLKESLSRQNIKMESFDVTTATNGGLEQQQSGEWRQTASDRRPLPVQQYGAARNVQVSDAGAEAGMRYFAPQYQSTLDVRF